MEYGDSEDPSVKTRQIQKQESPNRQGGNEYIDVKYLMKKLRGIKNKWYEIGKALKISTKVLNSFDDDEKKLLCVIEEVMNGQTQVGQDMLKNIAQALRDSEVNEEELASELERIAYPKREKCIHRFLSRNFP